MSNLPDNRKIVLINIPGSHDSTAYNINFFGSIFAKTQDLNIIEQLKIGIRKLDIRVTFHNCSFYCGINQIETEYDLDLICCHGICDCYYINDHNIKKNITYKDVLLDVKQFLEENPSETIILSTSSGRGNAYNNLKRATEIYEKIVGDISIKYNNNLTLGDVRGKIVYTTYKTDKIDSEGNPIYNKGIEGGTGLEEIHQRFVSDKNYSTFEVGGKLKVEEMKELIKLNDITIEEAGKEIKENDKKFPISYSISCTGEHDTIVPLPKSQADIVNTFILNYDLKKGYYYGWINIDFVDLEVAKKIIDTNFI